MNAMVGPGAPPFDALRAAGVRRLSQGAWGFAAMLACVDRTTAEFVAAGSYGRSGDPDPAYHRVAALLRP